MLVAWAIIQTTSPAGRLTKHLAVAARVCVRAYVRVRVHLRVRVRVRVCVRVYVCVACVCVCCVCEFVWVGVCQVPCHSRQAVQKSCNTHKHAHTRAHNTPSHRSVRRLRMGEREESVVCVGV